MKFTLVLYPDGKGILTTEENLSPALVEKVQQVWKDWAAGVQPALIVASETDVIVVKEIELKIKSDA